MGKNPDEESVNEKPARGPERQYTTSDILDAMRARDPPYITGKIAADILGCSSPTARDRLAELESSGILDSETLGSGVRAYFRPE